MNSIDTSPSEETRSYSLATLKLHRERAAAEFRYYKDMMLKAANSVTESYVVFDFAEKVLLPHLVRQPGQLHFVTGLK